MDKPCQLIASDDSEQPGLLVKGGADGGNEACPPGSIRYDPDGEREDPRTFLLQPATVILVVALAFLHHLAGRLCIEVNLEEVPVLIFPGHGSGIEVGLQGQVCPMLAVGAPAFRFRLQICELDSSALAHFQQLDGDLRHRQGVGQEVGGGVELPPAGICPPVLEPKQAFAAMGEVPDKGAGAGPHSPYPPGQGAEQPVLPESLEGAAGGPEGGGTGSGIRKMEPHDLPGHQVAVALHAEQDIPVPWAEQHAELLEPLLGKALGGFRAARIRGIGSRDTIGIVHLKLREVRYIGGSGGFIMVMVR